MADFPNIGDQIVVIENGKGGGAMPKWKGRLTTQQIHDVAEYTPVPRASVLLIRLIAGAAGVRRGEPNLPLSPVTPPR